MERTMMAPTSISSLSFFNINRKVIGERIGPYGIRMINENLEKPKPKDTLRFNVTVNLREFGIDHFTLRLMRTTTLLESSIPISCQSFFEDSQDFFRSLYSNPECSPYFIPESFDQISISQKIVSMVERVLEVQSPPSFDPESADLECKEFPLTLDIFVEVLEEYNRGMRAQIQESMQQGVTMIPASNKAIHSLQPFTDSHLLKTEKCNICMDEFYAEEGDEDDAKLLSSSSMPCGHVFHHECIVKWLQTSHNCPLCRYPMPSIQD